ncbi:trigger factor [Peptococcaceae bacterium 1198_IL3148]
MKATAEKLEKNEVRLEIQVDGEQFSKEIYKAYKKIANQVNIPGFRKGKAPKMIIEQRFGKEALVQEAVEQMFPTIYKEALEQTNIKPIDQPQVEDIQGKDGEPLVLKLKVAVQPEVKLGQYKGFEINKPSVEVTEEDVQKELEMMQNRHAKLISVEDGAIENGDTAIIDFTGYIDGEAFEGGSAEGFSLVIGSGTFIPGFEEQMIGVKTGEEKDVNVTFPADYHAEDVAGKEAVFKVKVSSIKRKELAALDDEFAKDVSEFDTLEELKADLVNKLKERKESQAKAEITRQAIEKAIENAEVEIPEKMVNNRVEDMIQNMSNRLRTQGIELEQYLKYTNSDLDELRSNMKGDAEKEVRRDLVLDEIAKVEGLSVSDEEVDTEIAMMAPQFQQEPAQLKLTLESVGDLNIIKEDILRRKTMSHLSESANIVE